MCWVVQQQICVTWLPSHDIFLLGSLDDILDSYMLNVASLTNKLVNQKTGECSLVSCVYANVGQRLTLREGTRTCLSNLTWISEQPDRKGSVEHFL